MFRKLLFILVYISAWVVFFELARVFFLLYEWQYTSLLSQKLIFGSLWYGLKMDISMACYLAWPVCLFVIAGLFIPFFRRPTIYVVYTAIILLIQFLLIVIDVEIFKAWGHRLDFTPLKYLSNPHEMWASMSHLPVVWIMLGLVIVYLLLFRLFKKLINTSANWLLNTRLKWIQVVIVLIFAGLLIIPVRGGFQLSPLNQSSVFFSNNQFANNAALNASWNFMYSVTLMNNLSKNPYEYMDQGTANGIVKKLFESEDKPGQLIINPGTNKLNIIFVVWESFTEKALQVTIEGKPAAPNFEQIGRASCRERV